MPDENVEVLRCGTCGTLDPGPREVCAHCHGRALEPERVAGRGQLVSWTQIRYPPERFKAEETYAVAVVTLDAGVQVTGRLRRAHEGLRPGNALRCAGDHGGVPVFEPVAAHGEGENHD